MNREYKFRAWDPQSKVMIDQSYRDAWEVLREALKLNMPIMQFTGLHDKNGTPIFEGDILKFPGAKQAMPVTFLDGCFVAQTEDMKKRNSWTDLRVFETKTKITMWEVIGNIWENPELLEDKK